MSHHAEYTMGGLLIAGGAFAYAKKKSMPSLVGGLVLGAGYFAAGYLIHDKYEYYRGHFLAAGCATTLTTVGWFRYYKTKAFFPGGALGLLGLASVIGELYFLNK